MSATNPPSTPPPEPTKIVTLYLTSAEYAQLQALAEARRCSMVECLKRFIAASQPGGSGWQHPASTKAKG